MDHQFDALEDQDDPLAAMNLQSRQLCHGATDGLGACEVFAGGERVQNSELLGCEADGDSLRGLYTPARRTATSSLQMVDVVVGFGFAAPPLDLLVTDELIFV